MINLPFEMSVNTVQPNRTKLTLTCLRLMREVPGKRRVYQAVFDGKGVIAKIFSGNMPVRRHISREWKGLKALASRKLNAPEPLFYGTTADNQWVIVSQQITNSATALELYQQDSIVSGRFNVLRMVVRELARLNSKGVLQKDVHLGNFLLKAEQVFALDVGQMVFYQQPIGRNKSLKQLAAVLCFLTGDDSIQELCREYAAVRKWRFNAKNEAAAKKYREIHFKKAIRKGLKKTLRTNKRCVRFRDKGCVSVFDKEFCEKAEPSQFIAKIDELMDKGAILKNGNTCYVSRINYEGVDMVIKRYNHKGFFHSLRHSLKGSRARRCWLHGHRLGMLAIPTPKPLGFIERRKCLVIWQSYIITEYVQAQKLSEILQEEAANQKRREQVRQLLNELLTKMHRNRITHGDLKHSNILITSDKAIVTDLDGMMVHRLGWLLGIRRKKDLLSLDNILLQTTYQV